MSRVDLDKLDSELEKWRGEASLPVDVLVSLSAELRAWRDQDEWKPLFDEEGLLLCDEGNEYLFAAGYTLANDPTKAMIWNYFNDAIVWDSETDPQWSDGGHGIDLSDAQWYREAPSAPQAKGEST